MIITIIENTKYELVPLDSDIYGIISLNEPNLLIKRIHKSDIKEVYKCQTWVKIRGCKTILENFNNGEVELNVRPSNDVYVLGAKEIDKGVFWVKLPISEVEEVWEERIPYLEFKFPLELERKIDLKVSDLIEINKRCK
jgi:hypothetical protein